VAIGVIIGLVAAQAVLFLWPPSRIPVRADAVVAFSGDRGERLARSLELVRGGIAPVLVLANGGTSEWPPEAVELCTRPQPFTVLCPRSAAPYDTRSEARTMGRLASRQGWQRVVVVTTSFHLARATLLFTRCYAGQTFQSAAKAPAGLVSRGVIAHEWAGVARAMVFARSC
jgi:uncharacterized SAM-binding protein YcdF (DUF218 family)